MSAHMRAMCPFVWQIIFSVRLGLCTARAFSWQVELWTGQTPPSLCLRIKCGGLRFSNELNGWTETFFSGRFLTFVPVYRVELISPVGASGSASWPPFMSRCTLAWFSVFTQPAVTASSLPSFLVFFLLSCPPPPTWTALMHPLFFVTCQERVSRYILILRACSIINSYNNSELMCICVCVYIFVCEGSQFILKSKGQVKVTGLVLVSQEQVQLIYIDIDIYR